MNGMKSKGGLAKAVANAYSKKWSFLAVFAVLVLIVINVAASTGFIPDDSTNDPAQADAQTVTNSPLVASVDDAQASSQDGDASSDVQSGTINMSGDLPVKISIPTIGLNATVANPDTTDVNELNNYLLHGAVRYPTSATLGEPGNMILFGHSSYLPVVINHAFKTFDGIQNLVPGDQIIVYSSTKEYVYSVTSEQKESELSDSIPLTTTGETLTLATCDSFTVKTDRFVVTATLVGSYALGN